MLFFAISEIKRVWTSVFEREMMKSKKKNYFSLKKKSGSKLVTPFENFFSDFFNKIYETKMITRRTRATKDDIFQKNEFYRI